MSEKNRSSSKEHLHDWSIYRQNVTSSMADLILSNASVLLFLSSLQRTEHTQGS